MSDDSTDDEPRGLYERMKDQDERWELWAQLGVGLLGCQVLAFIVAYLSLGMPSVYAYSVGISFFGVLTIPLTFWGLLRALFKPPVMRLSRTIAFGCLLLVGVAGNAPLLTAPVSTSDYESAHDYQLPFDGQWVTMAGGDDRKFNYHATTMVHRYGYDFAPVVDGQRYEGDGSALEDHHCYEAVVRAPVGGEVIQRLGNEPDNEPGEYDANNILGNHVVIEVESGEYLFMAHMREGSVEVSVGDVVDAGDPVGECGSSGRTQTPHLHVHLQNSSEFPLAESLPLYFVDYIADGEPVDRGMPRGSEDYDETPGQIVENRRSWSEMRGAGSIDDESNDDPSAVDAADQVREAAEERAEEPE